MVVTVDQIREGGLSLDETLSESFLTHALAEVKDTGFRPEKDGFAFPNEGSVGDDPWLTAAEMRKLFGDENVCEPDESPDADGNCVLTAAATQWMEDQVNGMKDGVCEGMAVAAVLFHRKPDEFKAYSGDKATVTEAELTPELKRLIGYYFVMQFLDPELAVAFLGDDGRADAMVYGSGAEEFQEFASSWAQDSIANARVDYSAADLVRVGEETNSLPGIVVEKRDEKEPSRRSMATRMGQYLRRIRGRVVELDDRSYRVAAREGRKGALMWTLEAVEATP